MKFMKYISLRPKTNKALKNPVFRRLNIALWVLVGLFVVSAYGLHFAGLL